jgi:transketolase C-terminal domain/subunit
MRTPSRVLYAGDFTFQFGKGYILRQSPEDTACLISSGRGVHEALAAAELCRRSGVNVRVIDMPSIDEEMLVELVNSGKFLVFTEQNNGYIWENLLKVVYANRSRTRMEHLNNVATINTLDANGRPQFIHSATYEELIDAFGLKPTAIARTVCNLLGVRT